MQANVNRTAINHAVALETAAQHEVDIVCIQEPWVDEDVAREKTQSHPSYRIFAPESTWSARPRAMLYSKKGLRAEQTWLGTAHPDVVVADISLGHDTLRVASVYNAGPSSIGSQEGLRHVMSHPLTGNTLLCGDYNAHHPLWDVNARDNTAAPANNLYGWLDATGCTVLNSAHQPTHDQGAVLDLAIASPSLVQRHLCTSEVNHDMHCGSDHASVLTRIEATIQNLPNRTGRFNVKKIDKEKFAQACRQEYEANLRHIRPPRGTEDLDAVVQRLLSSVTRRIGQTAPRVKPRTVGQPWWDDQCQEVVRTYRHHRRSASDHELVQDAKSALRRVVRRAKSNFFRNVIENLSDTREIFQAVKWKHKATAYGIPPLLDPQGRTANTTEEKAALLLDTHTATPGGDTQYAPHFPDRSRAWEPPTEDEVRRAIFGPRDTAPGTDSITNNVWKMCWPAMGTVIVSIFRWALDLGYHPQAFKSARLVPIHKPKRDKASPRSYRLISLLPTLGKGLERLLAKRLAREAIMHQILPHNYICATPKRAATDLTLGLVDEIEACFVRPSRPMATVVTFDVEGAFDSVRRDRLVQRLADQGWPPCFCKWTHAFLTGRSVKLLLDGEQLGGREIDGSLPQGSPISPILYMLFMAPLYKIHTTLRGYADDGCFVVKSGSLDDNIAGAQQLLGQIHAWCVDNGLSLDFKKTGLLHCTRRKTSYNPDLVLPDGTIVEATDTRGAMRWLGLHLDRKLTFRRHVEQAIGKAERTVNGMRLLAGCFKGAPPSSLLKVVRSCVIPQMTYAASSWWPLRSRDRNNKNVTALGRRFDVALRSAIRAALPLYKTTPIHLVHHAAAIPPMELILDDLHRGEAVRIQTADRDHPLTVSFQGGRVERLKHILPKTVDSRNRIAEDKGVFSLPPKYTKEEAERAHLEEIRTSPNDIWAYSDGSQDEKLNTGAGWAVYRDGTELTSGSGRCGRWYEVFDAEAIAAARALDSALQQDVPAETAIYLCCDNAGVVESISRPMTRLTSSQEVIQKVRNQIQATDRRIHLRWVPGHREIKGNERVDALAKGGRLAGRPLTSPYTMSLAKARRWRKAKLRAEFEIWWKTATRRSPRLHLSTQPTSPTAWNSKWLQGIPRSLLGRVLAARSAHGDFQQYHLRFNHDDAELDCNLCGQEKAPLHPWMCRATNEKPHNRRFITKLLATQTGAKYLAKSLAPGWKAYRPTAGQAP